MDVAKEKRLSFPTQNKQALLKKLWTLLRVVGTNGPSIVWCCTLFEPGKILCHPKGDDRYVVKLRSCFNYVLARMESNEEIRSKINEHAMHYEDHRGSIFQTSWHLKTFKQRAL